MTCLLEIVILPVFQSHALCPHMTVRENVCFSLLMRRTPEAQAQERIRTAAVSLGIEGLHGRYPRELNSRFIGSPPMNIFLANGGENSHVHLPDGTTLAFRAIVPA